MSSEAKTLSIRPPAADTHAEQMILHHRNLSKVFFKKMEITDALLQTKRYANHKLPYKQYNLVEIND